jgi:phosphoribosylformylglycinamidine synthase
MKFGVVVFPGSNCDDDMIHVLSVVAGAEVTKIWHKENSLSQYGNLDGIIVPGGFSYGDYLRSGAIAKFSPIMQEVVKYANDGGFVWGICNGFQILCETGLLPGVLLRNENQKFICKNIYLKTVTDQSIITNTLYKDEVIKIPIAHADGRYFDTKENIKKLWENDQVIFQYCDENGNITAESNPNGSLDNIAGISNKAKNVFGMMPHPERAAENQLGNIDGKKMFDALAQQFATFMA